MKVSILSMQHVNNFGSLLQAYALKKTVESFGCEVSFIPIKKIKKDYNLLKNSSLDFSEEVERNGLIHKINRLTSYPLNRIDHKYKEKRQREFFEKFRIEYGIDFNPISANSDLCIIGSDEVFNCLNSGYWGFSSQLFGNIPEARHIITYAVSCGATTLNALPNEVAERIVEAFSNVDGFSVRDGNTYDFVSKLYKTEVKQHFDPVLVYNFHKELERTQLQKLPKQFCIVYSYRNRIKNQEEIEMIQSFCRKHKLTPVAIGAPQFWIKDYLICSPFECLKIFERAKFVITDTFHGTIFSYKYCENFATIRRKSNDNKILDLAKKLDVQEHFVDTNNLDWIYGNCKNKCPNKKYLESEKRRTKEYLSKFINISKQ